MARPVGVTGALVDHRERKRTGSHPPTTVEALFTEKTTIDRYEKLLLKSSPSRWRGSGIRAAIGDAGVR